MTLARAREVAKGQEAAADAAEVCRVEQGGLRELVDTVEPRFSGMQSPAEDLSALLELLHDPLAPGEPRFSGMKSSRDDVSSLLDDVSSRLDDLSSRFDVLEPSLDLLSARRHAVEPRFSGMSVRAESRRAVRAPGERRFSGMSELPDDLFARADDVSASEEVV